MRTANRLMRFDVFVPGGEGAMETVESDRGELFGFTDDEVYALAQVGQSVRFVNGDSETEGSEGND